MVAASRYACLARRRGGSSVGRKGNARQRTGTRQHRRRSASRRGKALGRARARSRGAGRPRGQSYRPHRKGYGRRGRSVGRSRTSGRGRRARGRSGHGGSRPILFRARRGLYYRSRHHRHRGRGRARTPNSSSRAANTSDNYCNNGEEGCEKPTASVWKAYTCIIS